MWRPSLLALLLATVCGCQSTKPKSLSFGLFAVPAQDLGHAREAGADFVVGPQTQEYVQNARHAKLTVIATGPVRLRDHAISGYYLTDEPDLRGIAPDRIKAEYSLAKKDTKKPIFLTLSSAYSIEAFGKNSDIVMFDWYPVGWQPIETFYSQLRIARLAAKEKSFYAIVQAFNWADYPNLMPPRDTHRLPSESEVLAMATWAAMNGAAGIAFYPGRNSPQTSTNIWNAIERSIRFIRDNESILRAPRLWADYPFVFLKEEDKYNAVFETSIAVKITSPEPKQEIFLVAANTTHKNIEVEFRPTFKESAGVRHLSFSPFEVKILRLKSGDPFAKN
jgi:hypothetical protein